MEEARRHAARHASRHVQPEARRGACGVSQGSWLTVKLAGIAALLWIILRSGGKPSRLGYPCQQSAMGAIVAAFGAPWISVWWAKRSGKHGRRARAFAGPLTLTLVAASALLLPPLQSQDASVDDWNVAILAPTADYHPDLFLVNDARGSADGRIGGVDDLITLMGTGPKPFYRSVVADSVSGPDGIIAVDSVVVVKVNAQWDQRGGTNTDVLTGVLRGIVEHPDGFVGEIVIADNGQGYGNFNRAYNNAEDPSQSVRTVVDRLAGESWTVSSYLWDNLRQSAVGEFAEGDFHSGYVVDAQFDPLTAIRVSYPKFTTSFGTRISYKHGVWSQASSSYDADRLVVINLPVLKTHAIYGVTSAVKNHMGVVTQSLGTDSHLGVARGGLGSLLSQVRPPDLTILDCIWVLAIPGAGPSAAYTAATRTDKLVAGFDPVALDAWAVKFILIPRIIENGYSAGQYAAQDPDNADGVFRRYMDRTMNQLLLADTPVTNDYRSVRLQAWGGDDDRDGDLDLSDFSGLGSCANGPGGAATSECAEHDVNLDGVVDLADVAQFFRAFTGSF